MSHQLNRGVLVEGVQLPVREPGPGEWAPRSASQGGEEGDGTTAHPSSHECEDFGTSVVEPLAASTITAKGRGPAHLRRSDRTGVERTNRLGVWPSSLPRQVAR